MKCRGGTSVFALNLAHRHPMVVPELERSGIMENGMVIRVTVPKDGADGHVFHDAIGTDLSEAMSHFTTFGRFDLSLSEIFHMEFADGSLHVGSAVADDGIRVVLPVDVREDGVRPIVPCVSTSESECRRLIEMRGLGTADLRFVESVLALN